MTRYFDINKDGCSVKSKLYYNDMKKIKRVVMYVHGFGGHMDNKAAEKFADRVLTKYKDIAVLCFNLPCHGNDVRKKLLLSDCLKYLDIVINYIKGDMNAELYLYATSFGCYLSLLYINEHGNPFKKIVFRSPALNMFESTTANVIKPDELEMINKGKDVPVGFDRKIVMNKSFLDDVRENDVTKMEFIDYADDIIIMHGMDDSIVPFSVTEQFCEDNVIELIPFEKAGHRYQSAEDMERAVKETTGFLFS